MIEVEKIYTENPFVDNVIYYSKFLALNSIIKDEDEALANETVESLKAGSNYIACYEGHSVFEMFDSFPQEVLEKYITTKSNLDSMIEDPGILLAYLDSLSLYEKNRVSNNLNKLARTIYIDHYNIMTNYVKSISPTWAIDNKPIYDACINKTATYEQLFDLIPKHTLKRAVQQYINNYDNTDIDSIIESLDSFKSYIESRSDDNIDTEVSKINNALMCIFSSHYDIMIGRGYISKDSENNWYEYVQLVNVYEECIQGRATYSLLFPFFPKDDLEECLVKIIGREDVDNYLMDTEIDEETLQEVKTLTDEKEVLEDYFRNICTDPVQKIELLNNAMSSMYIANYNTYVNFDIYVRCKSENISYFELTKYIPPETLKIILNTEIPEVTNIEVYSNNIAMLNSYLSTLSKEEEKEIKKMIAADMRIWYVNNYVETNNYYRTLLGLPPLDEHGKAYVDTLYESYDASTGQYIKFGNKLINMIPKGIYPEVHWKSQLCEFDPYDISILNDYGVLDAYVQLCDKSITDSRYKYLRFLGDNKLDIYTCRKALNFQLISTPTIDNTFIKKKFIDKYAVNRDYIIRTVYSEAYKFKSDYYNKFIIIFTLMNTIMDLLGDIPKNIIDREVFDSRCIKYLFEAYGIPYYSEIPVKYQQAMLKNLNILIKYKSSTKNMIDICNLFGFSDIRVFGYYMLKDMETDSNTGDYLFNSDNSINYDLDLLYVRDDNGTVKDLNGIKYTKLLDYRKYRPEVYLEQVAVKDAKGNVTMKNIINNKADVYIRDEETNSFISLLATDYFHKIKANTDVASLKFIKVPIDENLTDYKNDPDCIINYDEIVSEDETWDGGLDHDYLEKKILDYEFNAVITKYISVETVTEMTELAFQVSYFYNMLFDNHFSEEKLTVKIPYIKVGHEFKFLDVVCYLFALMYLYNGIEDNIMYSPTQILYIKGYNFNEDLNKVLEDATAFTQPEDPMERENIFDINDRIKEDGYDYHEAFKDYDIKSFNLNANIDEIEEWLNREYQLSLDDFIVDDTLVNFDHIITLRHFYSLNNSYYQKDIFSNALLPLPFNQDIKYAFDAELYEKERYIDVNGTVHDLVSECDSELENSYKMEVIDNKSDTVYVLDYTKYASTTTNVPYALYYKYNKSGDNYIRESVDYYRLDDNKDYKLLLNGDKFVKDSNHEYVFAANAYYTKNSIDEYIELGEKYYLTDPNGKTVLHLGDYYILKDGEYILNPDNCWILVEQNGEKIFVLAKDAGDYSQANRIDASRCYVIRNGRFVPMLDTDHYSPTHKDDEDYEYIEEDYYVVTDKETPYYNEDDDPRVYFEKVDDYYKEHDYIIYEGLYYVKDPDGNFIDERYLVKPDNCYFKSESGDYRLVYKYLMKFNTIDEPVNLKYALILQENNNYSRCLFTDNNFIYSPDSIKVYVRNSDSRYILVLLSNAIYDDTKEMIVVLNKDIATDSDANELVGKEPEETDGVWDENDWFYPDPSYDDSNTVGMNGENKWYYRKPGEEITPEEEEEKEKIGSGFYLTADTYMGSVSMVKGCKYYMSMDIETNFDGRIQICNEADSECTESTSRNYDVISQEIQHISQVFIANDIERPSIKVLIYDFDINPIENGDYIIIKNIRLVKANSDNYIAQDIPSYDKLQEIYRTNEAIYKYIAKLMTECSDFDTYQIYKKLFDSLMTSKYNKEAFKLENGNYAKTYTDFLQTRDSVLYERLMYFKSLDVDTMHKEVADNIIEVTYAIDDCVDTYSYGYLYSYFPAVSANYIQQYISKIINFFKSWKVHLLGINTIYKFDDPLENTIKILEDQEYKTKIDNQLSHVVVNDSIKINPIDAINPAGIKYSNLYNDLVTISHYKSDDVEIKDRVRIISRTENMLRYRDNYTKIDMVVNDEYIKAHVDDNGDLIVNDDSGLSVAIPNKLILTDDETEQSAFAGQVIEQINKDTMDII